MEEIKTGVNPEKNGEGMSAFDILLLKNAQEKAKMVKSKIKGTTGKYRPNISLFLQK